MQVSRVNLIKIRDGQYSNDYDYVAIEEPLEINVCDEECKTFAIIMRTPGNDLELALGFLYSEGVIDSMEDVIKVEQSVDKINVILRNKTRLSPGRQW